MISFDARVGAHKRPFGAIVQGETLFLSIGVSGWESLPEAWLVIQEDGSQVSDVRPGQYQEAQYTGVSNGLSEQKGCNFSWQAEKPGLYFYHFELKGEAGRVERSSAFQLTIYQKEFQTPDWLKQGVMYQIFPDRFARSEAYISPPMSKDFTLREDWGDMPNHLPDEQGVIRNNDFFGGNLQGMIENLDYLHSLGITVIYLNPVFKAYSNHRYDTGDYLQIDPMLGTNAQFQDLCQQARKKGMRVILDGVFNHTGSDSLYFNKEGRYPGIGAFQSKDSPYFSWYSFQEYPNRYEAWWGIDTLPSVREETPSYLDFMLRGEEAVVPYWLKMGASGYRLDVADELPDVFLDLLRKAVKETDPQAAVIGEVWEDASNKKAYGQRRRYFQGEQLDSVMNYPAKDAILRFLTGDQDGQVLAEVMNALWENYPAPAFYAAMNILGTHDTPRIFTILQEASKDLQTARQKLFLALLIQFFLPGIPCIYYGDEKGMTGGRDPFNRQCLVNGQGDEEIHRFYRRLGAFRNRLTGLVEMRFQPEEGEQGYYAFSRIGSHERIYIGINGGNEEKRLEVKLGENERIKDFVIAGSVSLTGWQCFQLASCSGIVVLIG